LLTSTLVLSIAWARLEAIAAIHRLVSPRLERHFGYAAALAARGLVHLPALTAAAAHPGPAAGLGTHLFARLTAIRTAVGLVLKTFAGVKLLFACSESELASAVNAVQHFINVHLNETPYNVVVGPDSTRLGTVEKDTTTDFETRFTRQSYHAVTVKAIK
jgi:hypothetical protein